MMLLNTIISKGYVTLKTYAQLSAFINLYFFQKKKPPKREGFQLSRIPYDLLESLPLLHLERIPEFEPLSSLLQKFR